MTKWISEVCAKDLWLKLASIMTIVGFCVMIFWYKFDNPAMIRIDQSRIIQAGPFHPGESFTLERTYCSTVQEGTAYRYLVGDIDGRTDVYHLYDSDMYLSEMCPVTTRRWITIPKEASPGHYVERVVIVYRVNPLHDGRYQFPDIAFDVVKADH